MVNGGVLNRRDHYTEDMNKDKQVQNRQRSHTKIPYVSANPYGIFIYLFKIGAPNIAGIPGGVEIGGEQINMPLNEGMYRAWSFIQKSQVKCF